MGLQYCTSQVFGEGAITFQLDHLIHHGATGVPQIQSGLGPQHFPNVQNAKKGDFARHRLKGKRAVELGSGMGLGGFAFALLGCDTTVTDTAEVVSLLQRNYENNLSPAALRGAALSHILLRAHWLRALLACDNTLHPQ